MAALPSHASTVIIGGGIVGCSTAYHLGKKGEKDVCCSSAKSSQAARHGMRPVLCDLRFTRRT